MSDAFDPQAMVERFRERAAAVRSRPLPPVAGEERSRFIEQAQMTTGTSPLWATLR